MLQAVSGDDIEPLLKRLGVILGAPPDEAGERRHVWSIDNSGVYFRILPAPNKDPVLSFEMHDRRVVYFRMRQGEADGNTAGGFGRAEDGKVWLIHKGLLTLSTNRDAARKRTKSEDFERDGFERVPINIGGRVSKWYPIACLDDADCKDAVIAFAEYCNRLREDPLGDEPLPPEPAPDERPASRVPPRDEGWKDWIEEKIRRALRAALKAKGFSAESYRQHGLECDLLIQIPVQILFEIKKGNSPSHNYCAIGQLISYRTFFELPNAMLVAVLEKDPRTDFRPAFTHLGIELIEFVRAEGEPIQFFGLDDLLRKYISITT